jgi:hypothetical protein
MPTITKQRTPTSARYLRLPIGSQMTEVITEALPFLAPPGARQRRVIALPIGQPMCDVLNACLPTLAPPARPARRRSGAA